MSTSIKVSDAVVAKIDEVRSVLQSRAVESMGVTIAIKLPADAVLMMVLNSWLAAQGEGPA